MFCKNCGTQVEDNWKVCPACGKKLQETEDSGNLSSAKQVSVVQRKKTIYQKWWFWVLCVILFFFVLIMVIPSSEDSETAEKQEYALNDMDMESLIGKSEDDIKKLGFEENEDYFGYVILNGAVEITCTDGKVDMIIIQGEEKEIPAFHGVKIGMEEEDAYSKLLESYPEEIENVDGKMFLNIETKGSVNCKVTDGKVSCIQYMLLSDDLLDDYIATKEEALRAEYIFPDSDKKYLSEDEVRSITVDKLYIGRNEIFARHGYIFEDENLKNHFESTSWYQGTTASADFQASSVFNDFETKNVELIKRIEDEINGAAKMETEQQQAIEEARNFLAGHSFHLMDAQPVMEFQSSDTIRYIWGGEIEDEYYNYSISARYEDYRDNRKEWLLFLTIDGEEYYFRYFPDNGQMDLTSMSGNGLLEGWYELYQ